MGRPKSRQAPRTTMSIRVLELERRQIEEKAMAIGLAASAYIRTMALDGGNVDTTIHEDRQKLMHELSAIGNNINQIARMANTNLFISKSDVQDAELAYEQMCETKQTFGKELGRQGYHVVLSCSVGEGDPQTMYQLMQEFIEEYLGNRYEALFAVHVDKGHLHSHIVFNSVSMIDGYMY